VVSFILLLERGLSLDCSKVWVTTNKMRLIEWLLRHNYRIIQLNSTDSHGTWERKILVNVVDRIFAILGADGVEVFGAFKLVISSNTRRYSDSKFKYRGRKQGEKNSDQHPLIRHLEYVKPSGLLRGCRSHRSQSQTREGLSTESKSMIFIYPSQSTDRISIETTRFTWKNRIERSCGPGEPAVVPHSFHHHH
jgi:hypothetical protein